MQEIKERVGSIVSGGEMGDLIRKYNWGSTDLGIPEEWPVSLTTIINVMLNSSFPKFLFWGPDNICFYNDAYRPSLGKSGKHPSILGAKGKDAWPEIWDTVGPMIADVYKGKKVWMEDELIPIYRNGRIEDVYWTFSYSPVFNERGEKCAVLVTCMEMTRAVTSMQVIKEQALKLEQQENQLRNLTSAAPAALWMSDETSLLTYMNQTWCNWTGKGMEHHLGNGWAESIFVEDRERCYSVYQEHFNKRKEFSIDFRVIMADGSLRWTAAKGAPVFSDDNIFQGFAGSCVDITDRKKNEEMTEDYLAKLEILVQERTEELRKREAHLSEAQEIAQMASWEWDFNTGELKWSPEMFRFWGYEPDEFVVTLDHVAKSTFEEDLPILQNAIEQVTNGNEVEIEYRRFNKNGELFHIATKARILRNHNDVAIGAFGIDLNITQSKEKDIALLESEQLNRTILEILPHMVFIYDLELKEYVFSNRNILTLLGYDADNNSVCAFKDFIKILHPEDLEELKSYLAAFKDKSDEAVEEIEYRCQSKNGDFVYIQSRDTVYKRNKEGKVKQIIGVLTDISAVKKSARQLESMNELLFNKNQLLEHQLLAEFSESFASYKTGDEFFHSLSEEIADKANLDYVLFGKLIVQPDGSKAIESFSVRFKDKLIDNLIYPLPDGPCEQVIKGTLYTFPSECQIKFPKNQTIKDLNIDGYVGYPLFDNDGVAIGLINVMHSSPIENVAYIESLLMIAAKRIENEMMRIRNEDELEQKNLRLKLQNDDLTSFNHAVSHDLQEPIRKILMFISRMKDVDLSKLSARSINYLSKVQMSAQRMQTLVHDLLTFSSIEQKGFFEPVDLNSAVRASLADLSEQIKESNAKILYSDLPVVKAIPVQIEQLLTNIFSNSIKYAQKDIAPVIDIRSKYIEPGQNPELNLPNSKNRYIKLAISDNGIGFKQEYAEALFKPFKRLHNKEDYPGSGIGLAICQKIIQNHKGLIFAQPNTDMGSTFTIYLPV